MRLFILGESRFGAAFLRGALCAGHEVVAASTATADAEHDPLRAAAAAAGIATPPAEPIFAGNARTIKQSGAELLVLANVSRILPASIVEARPTICFHPSLLPRHRGKRAVAAAIEAGDPFTGVTIFWPDAGADTGPILFRARVEIASNESPGALYHNKLVPVGVHLMLAAVAAVEADCAPRVSQEELE